MLILNRGRNESVVIGDGLAVVTVLAVNGRKVRLGIEAHPSITVHRNEIQDKINLDRARNAGQAEAGATDGA